MRSGTWNRTWDGRELGKEEEVGEVVRSPTTAGALVRYKTGFARSILRISLNSNTFHLYKTRNCGNICLFVVLFCKSCLRIAQKRIAIFKSIFLRTPIVVQHLRTIAKGFCLKFFR